MILIFCTASSETGCKDTDFFFTSKFFSDIFLKNISWLGIFTLILYLCFLCRGVGVSIGASTKRNKDKKNKITINGRNKEFIAGERSEGAGTG